VKKKSCASKRAYKSSGRCVPKSGKARTKKRGCWAKTRQVAEAKMETYGKRRKTMSEKKKAAEARKAPLLNPRQFFGLGGKRRRRGRR
jgi:hypothetical protein